MSWRHCLTPVLSELFLQSSCPPSETSLSLGLEARWHRCSVYGWALRRHLLSTHWPVVSLGINHAHYTKILLLGSPRSALIYVYRDHVLEGTLILYPLSKTKLVSPSEASHDSWPDLQEHAWTFFCRMDFETDQKMVNCFSQYPLLKRLSFFKSVFSKHFLK